MSGAKWTRMAGSSVKAAIGRLRTAKEYAKSVGMERDVGTFLEHAHEFRQDLLKLAARIEAAEGRRQAAMRRQGRAV